jgi:hypothetical protein
MFELSDEELVAGQLREEEEEEEEDKLLQVKETIEPVHLSKSP